MQKISSQKDTDDTKQILVKSTMKLSIVTAFVAFLSLCSAQKNNESSAVEGGNAIATPHNWWEFGLGDPILDEVALFCLGHTYMQGADVAEVLETMYRTNNSDPWSWYKEFTKTAKRLEGVGLEFEGGGHSRSAGQSYLRAATYRRASLHRHPDPYDANVPIATQQAVDNFDKFLALTEYPCRYVEIPYEDTTLPGYFCPSPIARNAPGPTVIYNQGKDGWMEDGKNVVDEAHTRGWHVLLFDGPGMGRTIRLQQLVFRHDWEAVMGAVIDFAIAQPQVDGDNLAHISLSLGGLLAPRSACYEHRLKALVPNPGVVSWYRVYQSELKLLASAFGFDDDEIFELLKNDPAAFDEKVYAMMATSDFLHWGFVDSMWHHGTETPSGLMFEIEKFSVEECMGNITTATLVVDADAETRAQAVELYEGLTGAVRRDYLKFSEDEAAQFHDQPGAMGIQSARIFNWLEEVLVTEENNGVDEIVVESGAPQEEDPSAGFVVATVTSTALTVLAFSLTIVV